MGYAGIDLIMGGEPDYAGDAQRTEAARQQSILTGKQNIDKAFSGFNPAFYQRRAQAYQNFALPQVAQQYRQARDQIGFGLANKGLTHSSAAQKQWSDLFRTNAEAKQGVVDAGIGQSQDLLRQVTNSKNSLINQLYQTSDPGQAGQSATQTASSFQTPSTFAPVANQFSNLINQYYLSSVLNSNRQPIANPGAGATGSSSFAPMPQVQY